MFSPKDLKAISRCREVTKITGTSRPDEAKAKKPPPKDAHLQHFPAFHTLPVPILGDILVSVL
jgi:hypothetical protein